MKNNVVVCTHHKTGTVWMDGVFKAISRDLGAEYVVFGSQYARLSDVRKAGARFILFSHDSELGRHADLLERDDVRILHVIRDPRDVLISAMHYHQRSSESWLHEPIPGYDKVTYQTILKSFRTNFERYVFEMEHSTAGTVRNIQKWRYGRANCFEARYEDLRLDIETTYWRRISDFLGFDERESQASTRRFWQNSLFGGLSRFRNKHVRSGDVAQWTREFTVELAHAFLERFPTALQSLAYEKDDQWIRGLPRAAVSRPSTADWRGNIGRALGYGRIANRAT